MNIALLDASRAFRATVRALVDLPEVIWHECSDVSDCEDLFDREPLDIVITSRYLKRSDYQDVLVRLQLSETNRVTPVYLLTASETPELVDQAYAQGVTEVFTKDEIPLITQSIQRVTQFCAVAVGARVLLIEDQQCLNALYRAILEEAGFDVTVARNHPEAMACLKENRGFELVITDLNLGEGQQGQRLIRQIRSRTLSLHDHLPILVVSGSQEVRIHVGLYYLGIDDFLTKPVTPKQLVMRAIGLVEKFRAQRKVNELLGFYRGKALYDGLTNVYNRNGLYEIAQFMVADCRRSGGSLAVLYCDLDHFKQVNDTHGHDVGDAVLVAATDIFRQCCRENDVICRWGGDEFVLLVKGTRESASLLGRRILEQFQKGRDTLLGVGCSIGVASGLPNTFDETLELIDLADAALYRAKTLGRDRVSL